MKVSIITISFNAMVTIEKTLLSVANQSYENIEHIIVDGNSKDNTYFCKHCNNYGDFRKVFIPYSCKLLIQELMTMCIGPRLITN